MTPSFFRIVQGTEMNRRGIDGCGDIHEFQAKRAAGKDELANIAYQRDVGVVDGNVQIGLIVQACGLIAGALFLCGIDFVAAGRRIKNCRDGGENRKSRNRP